MNLSADEICLIPKDDEYLESVGFRDNSADFCVVLSRFADCAQDDGKIEVVVRDQISTSTDNLRVSLERKRIHIQFDEMTSAKLLGIKEFNIRFDAEPDKFEQIQALLQRLFRGLNGLIVLGQTYEQ